MKKALLAALLLCSQADAGTVTLNEVTPNYDSGIGDVNRDGITSPLDIDKLFMLFGPSFDYVQDGVLDDSDVDFLVHEVLQTEHGDANLDQRVNMTDFDIAFANFGATGAGWGGGDFNADGIVDIEDFGFIFGNFGFTNVSSRAIAAVPEPSTFMLLLTGVLLVVFINEKGRRQ